MLSIVSSAYIVPSKTVEIENDYDYFGILPLQAKIYKRLYGLHTAHITNQEDLFCIISRTVENCLSNITVDYNKIKYLIHTHTSELIEPYPKNFLGRLKMKFGLHHAITFGTHMNKCCSILTALLLLNQTLKEDEYALILTGETAFSKSFRVVPNTTIIGDAYTCILCSKKESGTILKKISIKTYGQYVEGLWMSEEKNAQFESDYFNLLITLIQNTLKKSHLKLDDIRLIIPHNVSLRTWKHVAQLLELPLERFFLDNIPKYAHCFGSDIILNYTDIMQQKKLKSKEYCMMVSVGIGAVFGAAVLQC